MRPERSASPPSMSRSRGGSAVAIIGADVTSGPEPLAVQFDGTLSQVTDDTIRDYFWDFGDGQQSQESQPRHTYYRAGEFSRHAADRDRRRNRSQHVHDRSQSARPTRRCNSTGAALPHYGWPIQRASQPARWKPGSCPATRAGWCLQSARSISESSCCRPRNMMRLYCQGSSINATGGSLIGNWKHVAVVYDANPSSTTSNTGTISEQTETTETESTSTETTDQVTTTDEDDETDTVATGAGRCTLYLNGAPDRQRNREPTDHDRQPDHRQRDVRQDGRGPAMVAGPQQHRSPGDAEPAPVRHAERPAGRVATRRRQRTNACETVPAAGAACWARGATVESTDPAWASDGPPL